jgi:hypothetical protein
VEHHTIILFISVINKKTKRKQYTIDSLHLEAQLQAQEETSNATITFYRSLALSKVT